AKVEGALSKVPGVRRVSVDLPSRTVVVVYEDRPGLDTRDFKRAIEKAGYDVLGAATSMAEAETVSLLEQQEDQRRLIARLQVATALSIPLVLARPMDLSPYTALLLALPVQIYGGWHFHVGLYRSLVRRTADMNTLVSLSTWAAFLFSAYVTLFPETLPAA